MRAHLSQQLRTVALAIPVGVLAGLSSAAFLATLDWATSTRLEFGWLLFLLPIGGLAVGAAYHHGGGGSGAGNNLILDEIHEARSWIPRRMAPLVYLGTVVTQLLGGSAGREGTAIQMAGSLTDWLNRQAKISGEERRIMLIAAIGGGFSAVFGVPVAGFVFALEVQTLGAFRWRAVLPTLVAAVIGNLVVGATGVTHTDYPAISAGPVDVALVAKVALAGIAFGLTSLVFAESIHRLKAQLHRWLGWPPLRPLLGGVAVIALTGIVGNRDYLGLSLPLIDDSLAGGAGIVMGAFALKLLFTAVTLGAGFHGGEVTPLFVIGATLGVTLGTALGVPIPLMAALGFVAVFAGATNTPIACTIMGIELFGWDPAVLLALACGVSFLSSGSGGIYTSQRNHRWGFHHLLPGDPRASV